MKIIELTVISKVSSTKKTESRVITINNKGVNFANIVSRTNDKCSVIFFPYFGYGANTPSF